MAIVHGGMRVDTTNVVMQGRFDETMTHFFRKGDHSVRIRWARDLGEAFYLDKESLCLI